MRNQVFVSYSHKDRKWLDELNTNLRPYFAGQPNGTLDYWDDNRIQPGARWQEEIESALSSAKVAVLLVTANYLASRFVATTELPTVFRRQLQDGLRIIWIPVSASAYMVTDLKGYQAACDPMRPLDTLPKAQRSQAWVDIAQSVAKTLSQVEEQTTAEPEEALDDSPEEGNIVLLYKRDLKPDEQLLTFLERELRSDQMPVFIDRHVTLGWRWADAISRRIEKAIAVIPILSEESMRSDMLADEVRLARKTAQLTGGRPRILPVRIRFAGSLPEPFDVLNSIQNAIWNDPEDSPRVLAEIKAAIHRPFEHVSRYIPPVGGALSPTDPFYILRPEDGEVKAAFDRNEATILLRGARQMGKTSMIARALASLDGTDSKTVFMDFQKMNESQLTDTETFYKSIMQWLCDELGLDTDVDKFWSPRRPPNGNLERFVQAVALPAAGSRLVWAMDEVDRLLSFQFANEFFGLLRTWHNGRSVKPHERWDRLVLLIAYATEPHLFITNLDQSPFNVGLKLSLRDFSIDEVHRLNDMYDSPLNREQLHNFHALLGGQPYLTRRGLAEVARGLNFSDLLAKAEREDGPFGDHLRRILVVLARNPDLKQAVSLTLAKKQRISLEDLYRLRRAGIFTGETPEEARPRCALYDKYLRRYLPVT